jgi:hypothetical protein
MKHVYGRKTSVKVVYLFFLGLAVWYGQVVWNKPSDAPSHPMELAIAVGLIVPALVAVINSFASYVAVSDESIETGGLFGKHSLRLDQISHRREYQKDAGDDYILRYIEFIPRDPRERALKIVTNHFDFDTEFRRFADRFPDIDQPPTRTNASRAGRAG